MTSLCYGKLPLNEHGLRAFIDDLDMQVHAKDEDGRYVYANATAVEILSCTHDPNVIGSRTDADFFVKAVADQRRIDEQGVISTGRAALNIPTIETWLDGSTTWVHDSIFPIIQENGRCKGTVRIATDVTEMEHVKMAISGVGDGLWVRNIRTERLWVSQRYKEILGLDPMRTDFNHKWFLEQVHRDDRQRVIKAVDRYLVDDSEPYVIEFRMTRDDGKVQQIYSRATIIRDENGEPLFLAGTHTDITEAFAARVLNILRGVGPNMIFIKDQERRFVYVSQGTATLYGTTTEDAIGKTDDDFPTTTEEQRRQFREDDLRVLHYRKTVTRVEPIQDADGNTRWFKTIKEPFWYRGSIHVFGVSTEITDLVETQRQLQDIIDTAPGAIYVKDIDGTFTLANRTLAEFVGFKSGKELKGMSDFDIFDPEYATKAMESDKAVLSGETISSKGWVVTRSGNRAFRATTKVPHRNVQNEIIGIIGIGQDVTDLEKQTRTEARLRGMEDLFNTITHETVDKILDAIISQFSEACENPSVRSECLEGLEFLKAFIDKLQWYVKDRSDTNNLRADFHSFNLAKIVNSAMRVANTVFPARPCDIRVAPGVSFYGDEMLIKLLIFNLIHNARKYGNNDTNPVIISSDVDQAAIVLSVSNCGDEIRPEIAKRFGHEKGLHVDPPDRRNLSGYRRVGGTGFGLYLCRLIALAHDGEMLPVEHRNGRNVFSFKFPVQRKGGK